MIYTIKKGRHYSTNWVGMLLRCLTGWTKRNRIEAKVNFSKACLTPSKDAGDVNKLLGLSLGLNHHQNSVRIGWRAKEEAIELFAYEYRNGVRSIEPLCMVLPDMDVYIGIYLIENIVRYTVQNSGWTVKRLHTEGYNPVKKKQRLYPYFGGTFPAPETMKIKIEWL